MEILNNIFIKFQPSASFLSDVIGIEAVFIGLAIPISLQVVTWSADRLKDAELARFFLEERLYKSLFVLLILNIVFSLSIKFIGETEGWYLWVLFLWSLLNIFLFYKFILMVQRYAIYMEDIIIEKIKKDFDEFFEK